LSSQSKVGKVGYFMTDSASYINPAAWFTDSLFATVEWMSYNIEIKEYLSERAIAVKTAGETFYDLGNTGMAVVLMNASYTIADATMPCSPQRRSSIPQSGPSSSY
jgi:hypothetical protein